MYACTYVHTYVRTYVCMHVNMLVYTSTRLTFVIEKTRSPSFHQSTGALRTQKWPPRSPKMTCVPLICLGRMLARMWGCVAYVDFMFAYAVFMLASVGSGWIMLVHVGWSGSKWASRCVYVGSRWSQDAQDGLPRSPPCQMSKVKRPRF